MQLVRKASSPSKRKDIEVSDLCDDCTSDIHEVMRDVQHYLKGAFMKRIVRKYEGDPQVRITIMPTGKMYLDFGHWREIDPGDSNKYLVFDTDTTNRVTDEYFFHKDNIREHYNQIKKTTVVPLHVKTNTLRREYEKFKEFDDNIENYIVVEKMTDGTSTLVQTYQMIMEYLEQMKTTKLPELGDAGSCFCKDAEKLSEYVKASREFIFVYYGACVYSRLLVYHAILHNLHTSMKHYLNQKDGEMPIDTEHWRNNGVDTVLQHDDGKEYTITNYILEIKGVKKWLRVGRNQHARKYAALYFQEVIDEVKKFYDAGGLVHDCVDKMVTLNEIFKSTLDLENGGGDEGDGEDGQNEPKDEVDTGN